MNTEEQIVHDISQSNNRALYDAACKRILADKIILAHIMRSCLEEYKDVPVDVIAESCIEGTPQVGSVGVMPDDTNRPAGEKITGMPNEDKLETEGAVYYDIRFMATVPNGDESLRIIINVEAQQKYHPGYPLIKRGIYYCARMLSAQKGTEFEKSEYRKLKKVYSIWICMDAPERRQNSITRYAMQEECIVGQGGNKRKNYDLLTVIMLCLGREDGENYEGILKLLEVLLSSEKRLEEKKDILGRDFDIRFSEPMDKEVAYMCNLSEGVFTRGKEQGRAEGRAEGEYETLLNSLKNLITTTGWNIEQAMNALGVPEAERAKYAAAL